MKYILKVLDFINVLEYDQSRISITNIALYGLIGKLIMAPNTDWPSLVAVIASFANYAHKRYTISKEPTQDANESGPQSSGSSDQT